MKQFNKSILCLSTTAMMALAPCPVSALKQDETVYAKLNTDGTTKYISVIEHLQNDQRESELRDQTILTNLENLNGFEKYVVDEKGIKWDAQGKDIYYRGEATKALPIKLDMAYKLDGTEMSVEEILGKKGRVEIELHFTNLSKVGNLYTPFVVAVATTLDEDKVSNLEVTNGKITSNGRSIAVAAIATPGLYESLGLRELKNSDKVVLSFETEKFELNDIYAIVTPKLLDNEDLKVFADLDGLYADVNNLAESSQQLVAGTNALRDGISELRTAVVSARDRLTGRNNQTIFEEDDLAHMKQLASTAAVEKIKEQKDVIRASVQQQIQTSTPLIDALELEAEKICQAQYGLNCTPVVVAQVKAQLVTGLEEELYQSSYNLALITAEQTASATAEAIAIQMSKAIQQNLDGAIVSALDALVAGTTKLLQGADELADGMTRFDQEGVQALSNFVNGKVKVTTSKLQQLTNLAHQYDNYAGLPKGADGETKFVLMIEAKK